MIPRSSMDINDWTNSLQFNGLPSNWNERGLWFWVCFIPKSFHSSSDTSNTFFFSNLKGTSRYYLVKMVLLGRQLQGNCCSEGRRWLWGGLGEASTLDSVLCWPPFLQIGSRGFHHVANNIMELIISSNFKTNQQLMIYIMNNETRPHSWWCPPRPPSCWTTSYGL